MKLESPDKPVGIQLNTPDIKLATPRRPGFPLKITGFVILVCVLALSLLRQLLGVPNASDPTPPPKQVDKVIEQLDRLSQPEPDTQLGKATTPPPKGLTTNGASQDDVRQLNGVAFNINIPVGWSYLPKGQQIHIRRNDDGRLCQITTAQEFDVPDLMQATKGREVEFEKENATELLGLQVPRGIPANVSANGVLVVLERKKRSIRYAVRLETNMSVMTKSIKGLVLVSTAAKASRMVRLQCMNMTSQSDSGNDMENMARSLALK